MFKIINTDPYTEESRQKVLNLRNSPNYPMYQGLFINGKEYWLKISITDEMVAQDFLMSLLNNHKNNMVEGTEHLGFILEVIGVKDGNLQKAKEELIKFINNELEERI